LHFLDRVCHLHRLPDPYEKTTRKWTMLESRKRQENDKKMTRKWQKNDLTNDKKWLNKWQKMTKNDTTKQEWQKNAKTKWQTNDKKMTKINNQQPSEFAGKIFIRLHWIHWGMMSSHSHFLYPMSWSQ
jgi:hypothetical protein